MFLQMPPIPECVEGYLSTLIQSCWDKEPKVGTSLSRYVYSSCFIAALVYVAC